MSKPLRIVFMGTPDFAAHILTRLCNWDGCEVVAAYSQPDRPAGRGKQLQAPAVKIAAQQFNIPVYQPLNFRDQADIDQLQSLKPDVLAVAAYGLILPQAVLDIPSIAPLNVHASLLPLYRGAAPIQRAIMDGHKQSGVSIMQMEAGLDTGPVYAMQSTDILSHTGGTLHDELAKLGADLLIDVLSEMKVKTLTPTPQDNSMATHATKLSKVDGVINFNKNVAEVDAHIRGVSPWPGAQANILRLDNTNLALRIVQGAIGAEKAHYAQILGCDPNSMLVGQIWLLDNNTLGICTLDKFYILQKVRPTNKGEMSAADFARGYLLKSQSTHGPLAIVQNSD